MTDSPSSSDEREWADASTITNPPEEECANGHRSPSLNCCTMERSGFYLDDTIESIPPINHITPQPLREQLSSIPDEVDDEASGGIPVWDQCTQPPPMETSQRDSISDDAGAAYDTTRPERSGSAGAKAKSKSKTKKIATRSKGTQVDIRLIGTSWPRVKKNPTNGEAGPSSGTRQRKKKSKKQENTVIETPEGSHEDLSQENTAETYTSQENLSSSQPDLSSSYSSPVENEQNLLEPTETARRLSVIHEVPSDFERSPVNQTQKETESIVPAPEQHSAVNPQVQPSATAPTPVIANLVINFSHSSFPSEALANSTIENNSHHNESTVPINIQLPSINQRHTNQGVNIDFESVVQGRGPQATSSHYSSRNSLSSRDSLSSDSVSTTSGLDSREEGFCFLPRKMPRKTEGECLADEGKHLNKKPAAGLKGQSKQKASDKKAKQKKATKKKSRNRHSRRRYSSESDSSSDSCSSYSSLSCSCSDCLFDSSDSSSDGSFGFPSRATKKKTTSASTIRRKMTLKK